MQACAGKPVLAGKGKQPAKKPLKKGPLTKGPLKKGPPKKGPLKKGPLKKGPLKKGPLKKGPLKKGPLTKGPLKKEPPKKGPLKTGPLTKGPLKTRPITKGPLAKGPPKKTPLRKPLTNGRAPASNCQAGGIRNRLGPLKRGPLSKEQKPNAKTPVDPKKNSPSSGSKLGSRAAASKKKQSCPDVFTRLSSTPLRRTPRRLNSTPAVKPPVKSKKS
ncbi:hypothetical protein EB796_001983 [Bugula neritina]|uniref:Uncharacterized protein n=1 Tax=Bugula neritina TaxID=10212 RepID=A0A7J7KNI8_BUGNE|nr:hypothetical protein EB796_001983 [Bugula neritina]